MLETPRPLTVVPRLPGLSVAAMVAEALRTGQPHRRVCWVALPACADVDGDESVWNAIEAALAETIEIPAADTARDRVELALVAVAASLTLVLWDLHEGIPQSVDSDILRILQNVSELSVVVGTTHRRYIEVVGRVELDAAVVSPSALRLDADAIHALAERFGVPLVQADIDRLANTVLAFPRLLAAVLASCSIEELETSGNPVAFLLDEAESYLSMKLRAGASRDDDSWMSIAVPAVLTRDILGTLADGAVSTATLDRYALAGLVHRDVGEDGASYRLDAIIRRVLIAELKFRTPDVLRRMQAELGRHALGRGEIFAAIDHLIAAGDQELAMSAIDANILSLLQDDPTRLHNAIAALGSDVRAAHPRLGLFLDLAWQPRESALSAFRAVARRASGVFGRLPDEMSGWDRLYVAIVKTIVYRVKGEWDAALAEADAVERILDSDADVAARAEGILADAHYQLGLTRLLANQLVLARESFARGYFAGASHRGVSQLADRAAAAVALVLALEGELDPAASWLDNCVAPHGSAALVAQSLISIARNDREGAQRSLAQCALLDADDELWLFRLHAANRFGLYWGDPVETEAALDRAWADHGEQLSEGSTARLLLSSDSAELALLLGQFVRAEAILNGIPERSTWTAVTRARLALAAGNPKHALLFILEGQRRGRTERYGQIELALLRAAAELALEREQEASVSLLRVINQVNACGVHVPFHLLPRDTVEAFAELSGEAREYFAEHGVFGSAYSAPYAAGAATISLSERELIVLRALEPGVTVDQIAKRLVVASNTVKAQLRSVYRKLGVSTRQEALLAAAELGLLDETPAIRRTA